MAETISSPQAYLDNLPEDRKKPMQALRKAVKSNLPKGYEEVMQYGMISYVVPHSIYPAGYHTKPKDPLPFISIGSQKNNLVMHHLGLYGDPALLDWFVTEYPKRSKYKLDMGKGCVRFKQLDAIPLDLVADLCKKLPVKDYIERYERIIHKK